MLIYIYYETFCSVPREKFRQMSEDRSLGWPSFVNCPAFEVDLLLGAGGGSSHIHDKGQFTI